MLRPATPLTIILFVAFVLLLISVISTPIVKGIPLASYAGVTFGVFGYCDGSTCSKVELGYSTESLYTSGENASFNINTSTRSTLSNILIVHPVAAFLTLVLLILAGTAHAHSPSHSPRYLLGTFILSILTLLVTLLAFLIDVLLFVPHMSWGSYIVLAATILIAGSVVVSCAMRRTLISRKARKRRIAENAEMNGENFFNRQNATAPAPYTGPATGALEVNKLPAFATFEMTKTEGSERTSNDERVPLTHRTPSNRSPEESGETRDGSIPLQDRYGAPPQMGGAPGMNGPPRRDQYGNLINPAPYGASRDQSPYRPGPGGPYRGRGGPGGFRGRGGPRGGYGGPPGRGGYGGPMRGGSNGMGPGPRGGMIAGGMMRGGRNGPGYPNDAPPYGQRRAPSPGAPYGQYDRRPSDGPPQVGAGFGGMAPPGEFAGFKGQENDGLARAESPPPLPEEISNPHGIVGQAVEMDATTGSPSATPTGFGQQFGNLRGSDADVAGMVGLQQQKAGIDRHPTVMSDSSHYSNNDPYVPPRQQWQQGGRQSPVTSSPIRTNMPTTSPLSASHRRQASDNYLEDIDPRFAELPAQPPPITTSHSTELPIALAAGRPSNAAPIEPNDNIQPYPNGQSNTHDFAPMSNGLQNNNSYEDIASGSRSPAESERSNFTSVSQRGINPRWNPNMGPGGFGPPMNGPPRRAPGPQRNEMLLSSNPDFEIPGMGPRRGGPARGGLMGPRGGMGMGGSGMVPRSAYDQAPM